jgi:hypothetical protein
MPPFDKHKNLMPPFKSVFLNNFIWNFKMNEISWLKTIQSNGKYTIESIVRKQWIWLFFFFTFQMRTIILNMFLKLHAPPRLPSGDAPLEGAHPTGWESLLYKICLYIFLILLSFPSGCFLRYFVISILYELIGSPVQATCQANYNLLDFTTQTILGDFYK